MACNGRNGEPGAVYNHRNKLLDLYGNDVEVDFRGEEVTVQNLIRLLTGRQDKGFYLQYLLYRALRWHIFGRARKKGHNFLEILVFFYDILVRKNGVIIKKFLDTPRSRRLNTDSKSNVLFYLTGHGGEDFLKFQDDEEISAYELVDAFEQMHQKRRYNELLFIIGLNKKKCFFSHINFLIRYVSSRVNDKKCVFAWICWFCIIEGWWG